ncbi:MAG TPA: hypothetical protein VHM19_20160, partial [Polyangiales bacterium]|nr:hypothetical protein [Polyangiales bacterium]
MKRALRDAGFETLDSGSFVEFDLKLRSRSLRTASRALLVLADVLSSRSQSSISALAELRAAEDRLQPQVVLTREFGSDSP